MNKKELLLEFKKAHPKLVRLKPKISISETLESIGHRTDYQLIVHDPPLLIISVKHPFIFDNRLVPNEFKGIEVENVTIGDFPKEFDVPDDAVILNTDYYHPEKYIKFVDRAINIIAKKLKRKNLTKEEALDAITGGFEDHLKWYNDNKQ